MSGYAKLFSSITTSSIWSTPPFVRVVWITLLAVADRNGIVEASVPGLVRLAEVTREEAEEALKILLAPDPDSRTKDFEGRRIEPVDGGWKIVNYRKYREKSRACERREYLRIKQQESRDRRRSVDSQHVNNINHYQPIADADADAVLKNKGHEAPTFQSEPGPKLIANAETIGDTIEDKAGFKRFVPPTLEEVKSLFLKAELPVIEAEKFFNHYSANGWKVGRVPMKSLTHAVSGWAIRYEQYKNPTRHNPAANGRNAGIANLEQSQRDIVAAAQRRSVVLKVDRPAAPPVSSPAPEPSSLPVQQPLLPEQAGQSPAGSGG